ncbi:anaerobic sulfite reductase subunit AsrA [Acidaminococcus timonensis]|jgi:anaerobic sulfite reductase subunit A|uniref:anaerobic sulfite reductase subunit AsrA n=1 Tax=Acidaminococcus timonensis TaxID=1871002 RepID=UPI0026EA2531|nr:anaerobic sulfite reductase subunit AsrA [Acidaminococcus timonensis]
MGYQLNEETFQKVFDAWSRDYDLYAPKLYAGTGRFSETDVVRYGVIKSPEDIVWDQRSDYSWKEAVLPVCQTLLYFTEDDVNEARDPEKGKIVFLRSCDLAAVQRFDYIFLQNGPEDSYYKARRDKLKFVLMGCDHSFEGCFCVSMGTNHSTDYDAALNRRDGGWELDVPDATLAKALDELTAPKGDVTPDYVKENDFTVTVPENLTSAVAKSHIWDEYDKRCIKCGRCTLVCPTCTCWSMQDLYYTENGKAGERRRVQASCMIDGYTDVAGGLKFRQKGGERMRFKVLHKVLDFKKRAGYQMCVGCGRCDAICPEYISFVHCIEKLADGMEEVSENHEK